MSGIIIVVGVVSFATGIAISYGLAHKRLAKQQQKQLKQASQAMSEAERNHESRMQETINSLRSDYDRRWEQSQQRIIELEGIKATAASVQSRYESQLEQGRKRIAELERIQATTASLRSEYEIQLEQSRQQIAELEKKHQAATDSLQNKYERELEQCRQRIAQLERTQEERIQEITKFLRQQYEVLFKQVQLAELAQIAQEKEDRKEQEEAIAAAAGESGSEASPQAVPQTSQVLSEELYQQVTTWAESGQVKSIPKLTKYANHQNADLRRLVASGLGKIAASNSMRADMERSLQLLGNLSQDAKPEVRLAAVEALGMIKSDKVLPFLQRALKDSVSNVRKSANASIRKLNLGYGFKPKEEIKQTEVKKPKP